VENYRCFKEEFKYPNYEKQYSIYYHTDIIKVGIESCINLYAKVLEIKYNISDSGTVK